MAASEIKQTNKL